MPFVPAAKGVILLTPLVLAAGYAIYESHEPFRDFVDEQWRKWEAFAAQQGWSTSPGGLRREERPLRSRRHDYAEGSGSGVAEMSAVTSRRTYVTNNAEILRSANVSSAADTVEAAEWGNRPKYGYQAVSGDVKGGNVVGLDTEVSPAKQLGGHQERITKQLLDRLDTSATSQQARPNADTASERSGHSAGVIFTPTTEGGSLFDDETKEQDLEDSVDRSEFGSVISDAHTDATLDMVSSVEGTAMSNTRQDESEDAESTMSSWSEVGSEISFDSDT